MKSANIFDALSWAKKGKKLEKETSETTKDAASQPPIDKNAAIEAALFSKATASSNWADEDEDTVGATAMHTGDGWNEASKGYNSQARFIAEEESSSEEETSENEGDVIDIDIEAELGIELPQSEEDESSDGEDQEGENNYDEEAERIQPTVKHESLSEPAKQQLSKKEQKKKELEDLDAVLAELGLESSGNGLPKAEQPSSGSSKAAKRRQKKERPSPTNGDLSSPSPAESESSNSENKDSDQAMNSEAIRAAKAALAKKKPVSKKNSASAAAVAAATKAKSKKGKDTRHYNEMPTR